MRYLKRFNEELEPQTYLFGRFSAELVVKIKYNESNFPKTWVRIGRYSKIH